MEKPTVGSECKRLFDLRIAESATYHWDNMLNEGGIALGFIKGFLYNLLYLLLSLFLPVIVVALLPLWFTIAYINLDKRYKSQRGETDV